MDPAAIYKTPRPHEEERPRPGDLAEIRRSHCKQESGLLVQVMGEPHLAFVNCADCGQAVTEWIVEVHCNHADWIKTSGPWFYPIHWLKRLDPNDPVQYARLRSYTFLQPTAEQIAAANR